MCGIAGVINKKKTVNVGEQMGLMLQGLKHRGPDSTGYAMYGTPLKKGFVMRFKISENEAEKVNAFTFSASFSDILNLITKPFFKGVPYIAYPVESGPLCLRPCNIRPICSPTLTVFFLFITPAIPHILFSYLILW